MSDQAQGWTREGNLFGFLGGDRFTWGWIVVITLLLLVALYIGEIWRMLERRDDGSMLTLTQTGVEPEKTEASWRMMLARLARVLEGQF